MWPGRRWVGGGEPRAGRQFKWLPGHCDISSHLKIMVLKLEITETRWYYRRHGDRRRSCWCCVVIQCPVAGLVVVRGGAGRRPTQPRPHPIPGLYPTITRPIQLHFPCFQRTIVVLTITMDWTELEIKWGISIYRLSSWQAWNFAFLWRTNTEYPPIMFPGEAGSCRSVGVSHFKNSSNEFFTRENICYKIMSDVLAGVFHFTLQ